jgi:hypothetical protein
MLYIPCRGEAGGRQSLGAVSVEAFCMILGMISIRGRRGSKRLRNSIAA